VISGDSERANGTVETPPAGLRPARGLIEMPRSAGLG
jgi:hypothetical protein